MPASSATPFAVAATQRVASWLTQLGVSKHAFDDTLGLINPLLTVNQLHAKVTAKRPETPSACTVVLQCGAAFSGMKPGQYVMVGIEINGTRHRRAYSPRAVEGQPHSIAITVQRQVGGKVSNHIHDRIKVGDIIEIEQAGGDFVLPEALPKSVLMIAGGSGITPCMAMIQDLQRQSAPTRVTLIYFARSQTERIFAREFQVIAKLWPGLVYVPVESAANTSGPGAAAQPVLDKALLAEHAPDWQTAAAFCCGPSPLMDAARGLWKEAGISQKLKLEAFGAAKPSGDPKQRHHVHLARRHDVIDFEAPASETLLVAGEHAGFAIKHGCRQGVCHECTCRLNEGAVQHLGSGEQINANGQTIQLCMSAPLTDLKLEALTN